MREQALPLLRLVVEDESKHAMVRDKVEQWWKDKIKVKFVSLLDLERRGQRNKFSYLINESTESAHVRDQPADVSA